MGKTLTFGGEHPLVELELLNMGSTFPMCCGHLPPWGSSTQRHRPGARDLLIGRRRNRWRLLPRLARLFGFGVRHGEPNIRGGASGCFLEENLENGSSILTRTQVLLNILPSVFFLGGGALVSLTKGVAFCLWFPPCGCFLDP